MYAGEDLDNMHIGEKQSELTPNNRTDRLNGFGLVRFAFVLDYEIIN